MKSLFRKYLNLGVIALVAMAFAWSWIFQVDAALITDSVIGFVLVFVLYMAAVVVTWLLARTAWRYFRLGRTEFSLMGMIRFVIIWAAAEMLIAWLLHMVVMGREGAWDNRLAFSSFTPFVMMTPLGFLSRLFGYFGTSALVGAGLFVLFRRQWKAGILYWSAVFVLALCAWLPYRVPSGTEFTALIVSETVDQQVAIDLAGVDFVLLPEYGVSQERLATLAEQDGARTVFSGSRESSTDAGKVNLLVYGNADQGITREYPKSRLIVFGEYLPFGVDLYLRSLQPSVYDEFQRERSTVKGQAVFEPYEVSDGVIVGNAVCSSIMHPNDYRRLTQQGATFLANSAALEIFGGSRVYGMYHNGFARFAAVANARPFLQSANGWQAFALDHNGRALRAVEPIGSAAVTATTNTKATPYTLLGEWVAFLGVVVMCITILQNLYRRHYRRPQKVKAGQKSDMIDSKA